MMLPEWFLVVGLLWCAPALSVVLFVHAWMSGALWRPVAVAAWCGVGVTLLAVSVALSPPIPGGHWRVPIGVLAGPLWLVWLAGQMVCVGVASYLAFRLKIR